MELKKISPPIPEDVFQLTLTRSQFVNVRKGVFTLYTKYRDEDGYKNEDTLAVHDLWQELCDLQQRLPE